MLSWRSFAALGGLLVALSGCRSAHIKDAYISRDEEGVRRTSCIQPQWQSYYMIVELMSFKEDTLLWPFVVERFNRSNVIAPPWAEGNEQLVEFGNIAPGKSDGKIAIEFSVSQPNEQGQLQIVDLPTGNFQWDLYLDDEEEPRESVAVDVDPTCPCVGTVVGNCN